MRVYTINRTTNKSYDNPAVIPYEEIETFLSGLVLLSTWGDEILSISCYVEKEKTEDRDYLIVTQIAGDRTASWYDGMTHLLENLPFKLDIIQKHLECRSSIQKVEE